MTKRIVLMFSYVLGGTFMVLLSRCGSLTEVDSSVSANIAVAYENDVKPIIDNYCITCHSGGNPSAGFRLTNYDEVRSKTEKGNLLSRINDLSNPMPQAGLLPKEMRKIIASWASGGFKEKREATENDTTMEYEFTPPTITPIDINEEGFGLLKKMQGHWVGDMNLMGQNIPWFAFDYRAIGASHVHGIFEGGTMGNLFTSFFVTEFNGKRTIMARNGGLLNGIYRTSYFVLDKVRETDGESYYRLVDAYGGKQIMWMELTFKNDKLSFNSYTSRFGTHSTPKLHMRFKGVKMHKELAKAAADAYGFPKNEIALDFSMGLPTPDWGDISPITSASFIWENKDLELIELGKLAKDPYRIDQIQNVAKVKVNISKAETHKERKTLLYLSREPLTNEKGTLLMEYGYVKKELFDGILSFPEINASESTFTFTYLHLGEYYLTAVADTDGNGYASKGDATSGSQKIIVDTEDLKEVEVIIE